MTARSERRLNHRMTPRGHHKIQALIHDGANITLHLRKVRKRCRHIDHRQSIGSKADVFPLIDNPL